MSKQVLCDSCGTSHESKTIFSAQKSFGGYKIIDVVQVITNQDLPANLPLKVCFLCASLLMTTMSNVEKTRNMIKNASLTKGAAAAKNKKAAIQTEEPDKGIVDLTTEAEAKSPKPSTPLAKNAKLRQRSKSMAARTSDLIFPRSPQISVKNTDELNASPAKTPKKNTSHVDDSLDDSVRLTPSKKVAANRKAFEQLFGSRNGDATPESEEEDEDDNAADEHAEKVIAIKKGFDCRLCDFQARSGKAIKDHLFKEHGQQRPRIYFCDLCPKSFGVLKSWKVHIQKVHGVTVEAPQKEAKAKVAKAKEQEAKDHKEDEVKSIEKSPQKEKSNKDSKNDEVKPIEKSPRKEKSSKANEKNEAIEENNQNSPWPQLATIKALNSDEVAKKKWLEKVINNPDYTFDVNGSSTSTPKAADLSISSEYVCDICDSKFATAKKMQEHMKEAHGIDKPKVFKCSVCDKALSTKQTLKHHMNLHNDGAEAQKSSKRKILQEEQEVEVTEISPAQEDDEEPQEEKIIRIEEDVQELDTNTADESMMAPPKKLKRQKGARSPDKSKNIKVDLMEEVNTNVKPHKKARLQSVSDSFNSSVDEYSTTEEPLLSCSQCGKQVKSKQRLALHIRKRHGTKLECPGCKTSYTNQRDYVNHFAVCSSGGSILPCGVANCKKSFYEANYLSSHLSLKHQWA